MNRPLLIKNLLLGFLSWLIPFAVSFLFYKPGGELMVPYATFKTTIMLVGTISGCFLLLRYFKLVENEYVWNGLVVGFSWLLINLLLDVIILIPMMKTSFSEYFMSIGLGYLAIPVISFTIGYVLQPRLK
jgi:hypothetical protein